MPPIGWEHIALAGALHGHLLLSDSPLSVFRGNLEDACACQLIKDVEKDWSLVT